MPVQDDLDWAGVQDVVVHLSEKSAGPRPLHDRPVRLTQKNQMFEPRVLAIPVGTTVEFPNLDPVFHNVFSYSKTKRFDLGRYGKGKSKSVTFDRPGIVKVFCDVHSNMSAYIYVIDSPFIARPNAQGSFELDVPVGKHKVTVWHPERGERTYDVTVTEQGASLDIAF